jgi:hypothetical protein
MMIVRGVTVTSVIPCCLKSREPTTDPAVLEAVAERTRDQAGRLRIGAVDDLGLPVEIEHRKPAPATDDARHLGESALRVRNMHEHPFSPAGVEGPIVETKRLGVADLELHGQIERRGALARLEDHGFAYVDPDRSTSAADHSRDLERIVAEPASEIEEPFPAGQPEPGENDGFARNNVRVLVALIEKAPEKIRLLRVIDGGKAGDVLGIGHARSFNRHSADAASDDGQYGRYWRCSQAGCRSTRSRRQERP